MVYMLLNDCYKCNDYHLLNHLEIFLHIFKKCDINRFGFTYVAFSSH